MNILNIYEKYYKNSNTKVSDFSLVRIDDNTLVGEDKSGNVALVIKSSEIYRDGVAQKTKQLSFECNLNISYTENGIYKEQVCHVIKCYSKFDKERILFLELCGALFLNQRSNIDYIVDTFHVLCDFFTGNKKLSQETAQGLYAELYTIYNFNDKFDFGEYWQRKDKMKFDFSISDLVKLEIKSTLKPNRIHRFKHDQLATNIAEIYVLSYKFQEDDKGLSLYELISRAIPLLQNSPQKQARLLSIIYDENNIDILKDTKYLETYTIENMAFLDAKEIPKFKEKSPVYISDAEYNSNCDCVNHLNQEELINYFIDIVSK